ncbi:MAG: hypothetical protein M1840_005891 [Geoglossum simile]|nr:MAG: hypothetical protein M1840_005891 [Geoglossum simile]
MAPRDREERMLMRQRGAGTHKLADVSFGIDVTLPEIPTPRRRSRHGKTPASVTEEPPTTRRKSSEARLPTVGVAAPAVAVKGGSKGQNLKGPASVRDPSTLYHPPATTRSTRSSGPPTSEGLPYGRPRKSRSTSAGRTSSPLLKKRPSTSRKADVLDLSDESREEVGTQPGLDVGRFQTADMVGTERAPPPISNKRKIESVEAPDSNPSMPKRRRRYPPSTPTVSPMAGRGYNLEQRAPPNEASKEPPIRNNRGRPKKSSTAKPVTEGPGNRAETEGGSRRAAPRVGGLSRGHRRSNISPMVISNEGEQGEEEAEGSEGTEDPLEQSQQRRTTESNVQTRKQIVAKDRRRSSAAPATRKAPAPTRARPKGPARRVPDRETVPILVHRLSTRHSGDYAGEDAIFDPIPPHSNRSGVNAVDVLSQICRELITGSVEKLQQGAEQEDDNVRLREWKRKRKAIETFGEELEERLFEMTEALDYNHVLTLKLRKANKEKYSLREKLLQVRREREVMALRMDEARRKHEEGGKVAENRNALNTSFYDIEVAIERGRAHQQKHGIQDSDASGLSGLEARLVNVAADVSSTSDTGSLLGRVKDFNTFLERVAAVLEGRL